MRALDIEVGPLAIRFLFDNALLSDLAKAELAHLVSPPCSDPKLLRVALDPRWPDRGEARIDFAAHREAAFDGRASAPVRVRAALETVAGFDDERLGIVQGALRDILRFAIETWLPAAGGFSLHAASVVYRSRGILVYGDSGAGKSTFASLAGQAFSDEWSIVFRRTDGWYLSSTGFIKRFVGTQLRGKHPVHLALTPSKNGPLAIGRLSQSEAVAGLLRQCDHIERTVEMTARQLQRVSEFAAEIPAVRFCYAPRSSSLDWLIHEIEQLGW